MRLFLCPCGRAISNVIDGEVVFGVVLPDGSQATLKVTAQEYIKVPAGAEHWFFLTESKRFKGVRYFSASDEWEATFTGTKIVV